MAGQYDNEDTVTAKLKRYYFNPARDTNISRLHSTARLMSDAMFEAPKAKFMDKMAAMGHPVYEFHYTHR